MNEVDAKRIIERLQGYYGPAKEEAVRQYGRVLRTMAYAKADATVDRCIDSCVYFPKVAEFLKAAGKGVDLGDQGHDGPSYQDADEERTMAAPLSFLADYDYCPHDCQPCDGTMGGQFRTGLCGWDRWKIHQSVRWLQRQGRTIPRNVVAWMDKRGVLGTGAAQGVQGSLGVQDIRL